MTNGLDRAVRKRMILSAVRNNPGISTRALAKQCGMAYGTHFRQIVQEVYHEGLIWHCEGERVANRLTNRWFPPIETDYFPNEEF